MHLFTVDKINYCGLNQKKKEKSVGVRIIAIQTGTIRQMNWEAHSPSSERAPPPNVLLLSTNSLCVCLCIILFTLFKRCVNLMCLIRLCVWYNLFKKKEKKEKSELGCTKF